MASPTGPLQTVVDAELQGTPRGDQLAQAVAQRRMMRAPMAGDPTYAQAPPVIDLQDPNLILTWGDFQQRHPEWKGDYWSECRALYAGGQRLLGDQKLLERLFPKHLHEAPDIYEARKSRAHYFPYPGTILDHLLAGLGTDPLKVSFSQVDDKGKATTSKSAEWWERWVSDVTDEAESPSDYGMEYQDDDDDDEDEGGCSLHHFLIDCLREALQTQTAWVLGDLPRIDPDDADRIDSQLAAEESGILDPYLCLCPSENVVDWQTDDRQRLTWVMVLTMTQPRDHPRLRRGKILYTYTLWTADTWTRYQVLVDPRQPPNENTQYRPIDAGLHGFGRVPFERLCLSDGLYAMGKLHSLAREHFNKRCAMSWAEYKSLFSILYEFLGAGDKNGLPVADVQQDDQRAVNQIRGQGFTQTRGEDDRAEWVGPPVDPFVAARDSCNDTMREMHRVMFSMAMSANMDAAALSRSAESKDKDAATTEVLLDAFGMLLLRFGRRLILLASLGRQQAAPPATITGLSKFDIAGVDVKIAEAVQLFAGVPMLSSLVKELYLARLYGEILGDLSQEQLEEVREEIRESLSQEELAAAALAGMGGGPAGGEGNQPGKDDEDEQPEPEQEPQPPAKPAGIRSMKRKSASSNK